ncbi:MAG: AmmeMemoRadiSam system protein B [Candidatus Methanomethyliaceae archaeon]|nr:AmmeMemoRadiSam system protein B [Candidatus Methanomethyliaceae archaeon]MDD1766582.1 AmmeMemoRadiSam system protein B [Candidatus Methanomethyliaceae archaeon]
MEDTILRDRPPSVAGTFYEASLSSIKDQLKWCFLHKVGPGTLPEKAVSGNRRTLAIISPHAGYLYSGPVAAHGYYQLSKEPPPDVVVLLGPNHTGAGAGVSIWAGEDWITPLGKVAVNNELAKSISKTGAAELDEEAHLYEHSIEVQLPFLQYIYEKSFKIVPICMMLQDYGTSLELGRSLAKVLGDRSALLIASTDFSHYEPYSVAYKKDAKVAEAILAMDARGVGETVIKEGVSMCGPGPVMSTIVAAQELGAKSCKRLCYATSGDTSGSRGEVVGYGSFIMTH